MAKITVSPVIIASEKEKEKLLKEKPYLTLVDALKSQLKELFVIDNHKFIGVDEETIIKSEEFEEYAKAKEKEVDYIFYPWNNHIVRTVKKDDYLKLKTNRNQNLITASEQQKLRDLKVAVFGCSVGSNIAFVLTQTGVANKIILADFDELSTTNMNRIQAGAHQIGLNKTIIAARRIYEDNPYAEVVTMENGIDEKNLEKMLRDKEIDCIIEEIDNVGMKIITRQLAMKYKVPVVMITDNGDGVVLHIERYDLGYDQIFHHEPGYWEEILRQPITKDMAGKIIVGEIVGGPQFVDPKMLACVPRVIAKELVSWPQLGSSAILGGVVANYAIKQIVSGNKQLVVREYINMPKI